MNVKFGKFAMDPLAGIKVALWVKLTLCVASLRGFIQIGPVESKLERYKYLNFQTAVQTFTLLVVK